MLSADIAPRAQRTRERYLNPEETLRKMALKIREAARDPAILPGLQQFAEQIIRKAGHKAREHIGNRQAAQVLLDWIRQHVRYRPDPPMVEFIKGAPITLCLPGADACIPVGDCDDLVVALASLCMAYGIEAQVVVQDFGPDDDLHVLCAVKGDQGEWLAADPSHPSMPVGQRARAIKEVWVDPLDTSGLKATSPDAEFVSVGALPRMIGDAGPNNLGWFLVTPASDGSLPVVAGTRYQLIVVTPVKEPLSGVIALLPAPLAQIPWLSQWSQGGQWNADDTTNVFASAGWLVERATPSGTPGAWTVLGIPKSNMSLQSTSDVTYVQVLTEATAAQGAAPSTPGQAPASGPTIPTAAKVLVGGVIVSVVAGGIFNAAERYKRANGRGALESMASEASCACRRARGMR